MRISLAIGSIFLSLSILAGCASAPDPVAVEQARLAALAKMETQAEYDIRAVLTKQETAWNNGDIDGYMEGYLPTEELRFASGDSITWGFQETLGRYKSNYDSLEKMGQLSLEIQELKVFTNTDATVFGRWYLMRPEQGDEGGLFTLIFEKQNGQWLVVSDHTS